MIKIVEIKNREGVMELLFEQKRNEDNGRLRSSYFYRGMPDASFNLSTSLQRNCGNKYQILEHHFWRILLSMYALKTRLLMNQFGKQ